MLEFNFEFVCQKFIRSDVNKIDVRSLVIVINLAYSGARNIAFISYL